MVALLTICSHSLVPKPNPPLQVSIVKPATGISFRVTSIARNVKWGMENWRCRDWWRHTAFTTLLPVFLVLEKVHDKRSNVHPHIYFIDGLTQREHGTAVPFIVTVCRLAPLAACESLILLFCTFSYKPVCLIKKDYHFGWSQICKAVPILALVFTKRFYASLISF